MRLSEAVYALESCETLEQLQAKFQALVEDYGFSSFAFVEVGRPEQGLPFAIPTNDRQWVADYVGNEFIHYDPVIPVVRRSNLPFRWSDLPSPRRTGKRKSGAFRTMEAARDHGYEDGLVVPVHFVDSIGRASSASCVLFWRDRTHRMSTLLNERRSELRVLTTYFAQSVIGTLSRDAHPLARDREDRSIGLTDREREALAWAGRGKTVAETAVILEISYETIESHLRNAMRKLESVNKTQAVARAIKFNLIDL